MAQLLRQLEAQVEAVVFGLLGLLVAVFLHTHILPAQELLDKVILAALAHFRHISHLVEVAALEQRVEAGTALQTAMVVMALLGAMAPHMLAVEAVLAQAQFQVLVLAALVAAARLVKMKARPAAQILAAALAALLRLVQRQMVALESLSFVTWAHKKALAARSLHLAATPITPSHLLGRTQHEPVCPN